MTNNSLSIGKIKSRIYTIRGMQVMLDKDMAELYEVNIKALNQNVKRNIERFPENFMFQLTKDESSNIRSQIVTLNKNIQKVRHCLTNCHGAIM